MSASTSSTEPEKKKEFSIKNLFLPIVNPLKAGTGSTSDIFVVAAVAAYDALACLWNFLISYINDIKTIFSTNPMTLFRSQELYRVLVAAAIIGLLVSNPIGAPLVAIACIAVAASAAYYLWYRKDNKTPEKDVNTETNEDPSQTSKLGSP